MFSIDRNLSLYIFTLVDNKRKKRCNRIYCRRILFEDFPILNRTLTECSSIIIFYIIKHLISSIIIIVLLIAFFFCRSCCRRRRRLIFHFCFYILLCFSLSSSSSSSLSSSSTKALQLAISVYNMYTHKCIRLFSIYLSSRLYIPNRFFPSLSLSLITMCCRGSLFIR